MAVRRELARTERSTSLPSRLRIWLALALPFAALGQAPDTISTYAGGGPNNVPAISANIPFPIDTILDSSGNYYIVIGAGSGNTSSRVFEVNTSGTLTVIAGNGFSGYAGDGGAAVNAELGAPGGFAVDSSGDIYIADTVNCIIRKVTRSNGVISTYAGTVGTCGYAGDGGAAISAQLNEPESVAVDASGNLYIADTYNQRIRKITASNGDIATIAGNGATGFSGDGGAATSAELNYPFAIALDSSANVYIADTDNYRIRKITVSTGNIATIGGNGTEGFAGDGGTATSAEISDVYGLSVDPSGNVFIADHGNCVIREVSTSGKIATVAGKGQSCGYSGDGGAATSALLYYPLGVAVNSSEVLYIADTENNVIRQATVGSTIKTLAGNGTQFYTAGATGPGASLYDPNGAVTDSSGNLYIADTSNCLVRKVTSSGSISTIAGVRPTNTGTHCGYSGDGGAATSAELWFPSKAIADSAGNVYIADTNNCVVRKVNTSGVISTYAGKPQTCGYAGNGAAATKAELNAPSGLAFDASGNLYIAETSNDVIREVSAATGNISTFAGVGSVSGFKGDGGPATSAELNGPSDIAFDSSGNMYIADYGNQRVRIVSNGIIDTYAGNGISGYEGDGGPATETSLYFPSGVAVDVAGDVLIADSYNQAVRFVDGAGIIYSVAGNRTYGFSGDGGPATKANFAYPTGVGRDLSGNIYVGDSNNFRVRKITAVPNLNSSGYSLTFPQQPIGGTSHPEQLTMTAVGPVSISNIFTTGDFAEGDDCPSSLASGSTCQVDVTFSPSASGNRTGTLVVTSNSFFNNTLTVQLTGSGGGGLTFNPGIVTFGNQTVGTTSTAHTVTFTNGSTAAVTFSSVSTNRTYYAIASNTCTGTLAVNSSCSIGVTFTPSATGADSATLVVKDSDATSPQLIPLRGTGVGTSVTPTSLAFGSVSEGTSKALSATVANKGTGTMSVSTPTLTGANAADFKYTTTCGSTLTAGSSCIYTVTFKPSKSGAESASLNIQDTEGTFAVPLTGTGK